MPSYVPQIVNGQNAYSQGDVYLTKGVDRNLSLTTGLSGKLEQLRLECLLQPPGKPGGCERPRPTPTTPSYLASQDAVIAPAGTKITAGGVTTDVSGTIQCWDAIQPQFATLYQGCVPINVFNPSQGICQAAYNYVKQDTQWVLTQQLDNIGANISGGLLASACRPAKSPARCRGKCAGGLMT